MEQWTELLKDTLILDSHFVRQVIYKVILSDVNVTHLINKSTA